MGKNEVQMCRPVIVGAAVPLAGVAINNGVVVRDGEHCLHSPNNPLRTQARETCTRHSLDSEF